MQRSVLLRRPGLHPQRGRILIAKDSRLVVVYAGELCAQVGQDDSPDQPFIHTQEGIAPANRTVQRLPRLEFEENVAVWSEVLQRVWPHFAEPTDPGVRLCQHGGNCATQVVLDGGEAELHLSSQARRQLPYACQARRNRLHVVLGAL
eukprot:scaffold323803_cov31-Tisochrysis_lutea.AAC.4